MNAGTRGIGCHDNHPRSTRVIAQVFLTNADRIEPDPCKQQIATPAGGYCVALTKRALTRKGHPALGGLFTKEVRRCPTLPQGPPCSTIGAVRLSFRVRNVTGRFPHAMAAETLLMFQSAQHKQCLAVLDRTSRTTQWTQAPKRCVIKSSAY